jgi:hypothetical protein
MRHTARYSLLDHRRHEDISELEVDPVKNKSAQYEQKLSHMVSRMEDIRYPEQLLNN